MLTLERVDGRVFAVTQLKRALRACSAPTCSWFTARLVCSLRGGQAMMLGENSVKRLLLLVPLFLLGLQLGAQRAPTCDVRAFGAKGDGRTLDTASVTNAIAACAKAGGGTVYFGPGRYVIGTVQLQSHIRLELEEGAVLAGSHSVADYLPSAPFGFARDYGLNITGEGKLLGMLIAKDAEDVWIEGEGVIDGQSDVFMDFHTPFSTQDYDPNAVRDAQAFSRVMNAPAYGPVTPLARPGTMIVFFHCRNVHVKGVTLRSASNWTMHLQDVEGASLSDFQILNDQRVPNNDGIDCMACRHVRIANCTIRAGDDGFAIVGSENMNVSNCSIASRSSAIRLESTQLSTFTGLSMDTNRGIAVYASSSSWPVGRPTENVLFSDIAIRTRLTPGSWWGKAEPIYIATQAHPPGASVYPWVRNVVFRNINVEAENGSILWGADDGAIADVTLNGVHLHMLAPDPAIGSGMGGNLDLRWTVAKRSEGQQKSQIPALLAKHVRGLSLRDVEVDWAGAMPEYFSDAVRVEDFADLVVEGFSGRQAHSGNGSALALARGRGVSITNSRALPGTHSFVSLDDVQERRVFVNYDLSGAEEPITPPALRFETQVGVPVAGQR